MTVNELINLSRTFLRDTIPPYLWSPEEMVIYYNDILDEFCTRTGILVDSTTAAFCTIPVLALTPSYAINPRILRIQDIRLRSTGRPLKLETYQWMDEEHPDWLTADADIPEIVITNLNLNSITLWPKPVTTDTLDMTVVRLPLVPFTIGDEDLEIEIPVRYHRGLVNGIMSQAYLKPDIDTYNIQEHEKLNALWEKTLVSAEKDRIVATHRQKVIPTLKAFS